MTGAERVLLRVGAVEFAAELAEAATTRPRTRGDCAGGPRPCPWVSCRHHLYLEVNPRNGSIKLLWPHLDPLEMRESCSLDVAERGHHTLEQVGNLMNVTRERMRQLEVKTLVRLQAAPIAAEAKSDAFAGFLDER